MCNSRISNTPTTRMGIFSLGYYFPELIYKHEHVEADPVFGILDGRTGPLRPSIRNTTRTT